VQLASIYSSPGFLLLANDDDGTRLGCVGLRAIDTDEPDTGEVRRLFVREQGRGRGLGRSLTERLISDAADRGFTRLVLNTLPSMSEAIGLYGALGFRRSDPYVDEPLDETLYFALELPARR
jgi:ribosomal protein S18 acetylase RimI-like enzyme